MKGPPAPIDRFFRAMQAGATSIEEMMSLFTEDAIYVEPFTGRRLTHSGKDAIRRTMLDGWKRPLPQMTIVVDRVDVRDDEVAVDWICRSPALPGGSGKGRNLFTLKGGLIRRLETMLATADQS